MTTITIPQISRQEFFDQEADGKEITSNSNINARNYNENHPNGNSIITQRWIFSNFETKKLARDIKPNMSFVKLEQVLLLRKSEKSRT